jgi:carboxymethylenebutenolidase
MRNSVFVLMIAAGSLIACTNHKVENAGTVSTPAAAITAVGDLSLPADAEHVAARLASSPRHGEWAMIRTPEGDSVKSWVVYPQRRDRAPVVIVIHEIYGLSAWARGVADQLAAAGFIAIAPDLLTMAALPRIADTASAQDAVIAFRALKPDVVQRQLDAVAAYGMNLPSAQKRY